MAGFKNDQLYIESRIRDADFDEKERQTGEDHFAHAGGKTCAACGGPIEAGQVARRRGEQDWVHDVCPVVTHQAQLRTKPGFARYTATDRCFTVQLAQAFVGQPAPGGIQRTRTFPGAAQGAAQGPGALRGSNRPPRNPDERDGAPPSDRTALVQRPADHGAGLAGR